MKTEQCILHIDTSDMKTARVTITRSGHTWEKTSQSVKFKSQMVLPFLDELLAEHSLQLKDITDITVNTGPGSFTGLRVGITIANTLSWTLGIPVNGSMRPVSATY